MVKPGWAWPSRSDTTLIGVLDPASSDAWVWRRSWNRIGGRSMRASWRVKSWLIDSGCTARPWVLGEDRIVQPDRVPVALLAAPLVREDGFGVRVEVDASTTVPRLHGTSVLRPPTDCRARATEMECVVRFQSPQRRPASSPRRIPVVVRGRGGGVRWQSGRF